MSERIPPPVMVGGLASLRGLEPSIKRVLVATNGQGKAPPGWVEQPGGVHMGSGRWLIPYVRAALAAENASITLSAAASHAFAEALLSPPEPNAALKRLMKEDWDE